MAAPKDITGQRFGKLLVIAMQQQGVGYRAVCRCDCGKEKTARPANLRVSPMANCGCVPRKRKGPLKDLTGHKFGFLEVVRMVQVLRNSADEHKKGRWSAVCRCTNCGKDDHIAVIATLLRGAETCGCRKDYLSGENNSRFTGHKTISGTFWKKCRDNAKFRDIPFELTLPYVWGLFEQQRQQCALSGLPLTFGRTLREYADANASLDRIDSFKGYVEGNVQWVHKHVNIMKNAYNVEYFVELCRRIAEHADSIPNGGSSAPQCSLWDESSNTTRRE